MSCLQSFKEEFSKRKALFYDCPPSSMYRPRCDTKGTCTGLTLLGCFRLASFLFTLVVIITQEVMSEWPGWGFIYYTRWGYMSIMLYFIFGSISSFVEINRQRKAQNLTAAERPEEQENTEMGVDEAADAPIAAADSLLPWYMKVQWICFNTALPSSLVVTLVYWGVLYQPGRQISFVNVATHLMNVVLMVAEQCISSIRSRVLHVYQPIIFGITYTLFTVVLWAANGTIVYSVFDWEDSPGLATGFFFVIVLAYLIIQIALYLISWALSKCSCSRNSNVM